MNQLQFVATLKLAGTTATGITVPPEIVEGLGPSKRPKVVVEINDHAYRSSIAPMHGEFFIPVSRENRDAAGIQAGEEITVTVSLDTEERTVEVPADFQAALDAVPAARSRFVSMSYSHRKEHVRAIESAKMPETRMRRIQKAVEMLEG